MQYTVDLQLRTRRYKCVRKRLLNIRSAKIVGGKRHVRRFVIADLYYCHFSLGCHQVFCRVSKPHVRLDKRRRLPFVIVSSLTSAASCSLLNYQHREIRDPDIYVHPDVQRRTGKCLDTPQYVNPGWTRVSQKAGNSDPGQPGLSISRHVHPCQAVKSCSGRVTGNHGQPRLAEPADWVEPCTLGLTQHAASNTGSGNVRGGPKGGHTGISCCSARNIHRRQCASYQGEMECQDVDFVDIYCLSLLASKPVP